MGENLGEHHKSILMPDPYFLTPISDPYLLREAQAIPDQGRALFERSELRSPRNRRASQGTRRVTAGRKWFSALLPKQKGLGCRAETRHNTNTKVGDAYPTKLTFKLVRSPAPRPSLQRRGMLQHQTLVARGQNPAK